MISELWFSSSFHVNWRMMDRNVNKRHDSFICWKSSLPDLIIRFWHDIRTHWDEKNEKKTTNFLPVSDVTNINLLFPLRLTFNKRRRKTNKRTRWRSIWGKKMSSTLWKRMLWKLNIVFEQMKRQSVVLFLFLRRVASSQMKNNIFVWLEKDLPVNHDWHLANELRRFYSRFFSN